MDNKVESIEFQPLIPDKWDDLEQLFGKKGAVGGCWCMYWRQTGVEFGQMRGEKNRLAFKSLVESGTVPGILAYQGSEPTGWCAIGPRESYSRLARTKVLAPVDTQPAWSITCFYIAQQHRRKGLMRSLLNAAIDWAGNNGARVIESYPFDPPSEIRSAAYTGVVPVYIDTGFIEVMRRSPRRPIMRKFL